MENVWFTSIAGLLKNYLYLCTMGEVGKGSASQESAMSPSPGDVQCWDFMG